MLDGLDRNGQPAATASLARDSKQQQRSQERTAPQPAVHFAGGTGRTTPAMSAAAAPVGAGPVAGAAGSMSDPLAAAAAGAAGATGRYAHRDPAVMQQELWRLQVQARQHEEMWHQVLLSTHIFDVTLLTALTDIRWIERDKWKWSGSERQRNRLLHSWQ